MRKREGGQHPSQKGILLSGVKARDQKVVGEYNKSCSGKEFMNMVWQDASSGNRMSTAPAF